MQKLGIMFVNSIKADGWGGGEKWMIEAASGLAEKGHRVFMGVKPGSKIENRAKDAGLSVIPIKIHSDFDPFESLRISRILKHLNIDVLICNFNKDVRVAGLAAKLAGTPVVLARHGIVLCGKKWKHKLVLKNLTNGIITNTNTIKAVYNSYGWWEEDFVKVIYNGIRTNREIPPFNFAKEFPQSKNRKVILSCGRISQQKGFHQLIPVARLAKKENKPWIFIIIGTGELEQELRGLIIHENLTDTVILAGFMENALPAIKAADLLLHPALFEGMPNVVMEAMLCKTAVLASDVNGTSELVEDGISGKIFPPQDIERIWQELQTIMQNDELRNSYAEEGYQRVISHFSRDIMIGNLENFFYEKLQGKK